MICPLHKKELDYIDKYLLGCTVKNCPHQHKVMIIDQQHIFLGGVGEINMNFGTKFVIFLFFVM